MALSSAGWAAPAPVPVPGCSGPSPATACCSTVLMSVRVSVCHSGIRPLCMPGKGSDALRLQLSMDPSRAGEFRLALRDTSRTRSVFIAEFDLRSVQYEVKSSRCHEMHLLAPPQERPLVAPPQERPLVAPPHERPLVAPPHERPLVAPPHERPLVAPPHERPLVAPPHERPLVAPPHERPPVAPPHDCIRFNFRCDREAEEWATVVMSSLREAHRVASISRNESENQSNAEVTQQWSPASLPISEELCLELSRAIETGDCQAASHYAAALARQKASLSVRLSEKSYADAEISLSVVVEDVSSSCCVSVRVVPFMTVGALKQQVFEEHGFPPRVQRWVISQSLCTERRSLASYGVQRDGDTAYLYLISARQAHITRQLLQQDLESPLLAPPLPPGNGPASQDWRGYSTLPSRLHHAGGGCDVKDKLNLNGPLHKTRKNQTEEWACPSCTFINKPNRPGCEICTTARPDNTTHTALQQDKVRQDDRGEGAPTTTSSSSS